MNNQEIAANLWKLCNVLRDDGITYHRYVTELSYILFLKMIQVNGTDGQIPAGYRWDALIAKQGVGLKQFYNSLLTYLGENSPGRIREIYASARSNIDEPKNLEKIVVNIDALDWYSAKEMGLGNLFEGLLEKNANEKKSGAGQYYTPRVLIDVMVRLIAPQPGEMCNDPACGTFGFMIAADKYIKAHTRDYCDLTTEQREFQKTKAFRGCELVRDTRRLALMNATLHGIEGEILMADALSNQGKQMKDFDVVLANPPFGAKKGGERATRDDFLFPTSNKQLNFLQHIYQSLNRSGKARAAVVLPDNALYADGDDGNGRGAGAKIRADLMDKCDLHTILRLPTRILYAQDVNANVLFFTRGAGDRGNTKEVWFYDMRANAQSHSETAPLKRENFDAFVEAYNAVDRSSITDERWRRFTRKQISDKGDNLDLGLIRDDGVLDYGDLQDPVENSEEIAAMLEEAADIIMGVARELKNLIGS